MNLYTEFVGRSNDPDKAGIAQVLTQTLAKKDSDTDDNGPLILLINSDMYIYDSNAKLLLHKVIRTDPDTGFFEMTAISHIGPAISYLVTIKENGGDWKTSAKKLLADIVATQKVNDDTQDPWLNRVNAPSWKTYLPKIHDMTVYALAMSNDYLTSVLNNERTFTRDSVATEFLAGNESYPIPFNNVMIGTFMLTTLTEMVSTYEEIKKLNLNWKEAKILIRFVAGTNYTAGVTTETNWLSYFLRAAAGDSFTKGRLYIAPYAEVKPTLGQETLSAEDYSYYADQVWGSINQSTQVSRMVFTSTPSIYVASRPPIPGDYEYSSAENIDDFAMRLKFVLGEPGEMLSNATAFWMAGELANKNWDPSKIAIPGLTTGFPKGITSYPTSTPNQ